ncbi:cysteine proteinase, partial [Auricularia subglabra TFB-10046 SS5]
TLFSALRSLFIYISHNADDKGTVSPLAFVNKVRQLHEPFRSPAHQDAHEFMNYLLNKIVEDIDSDAHITFVHALFEGVLTSETRCLTCENVSSRDESFLDLSIDIEQNSSVTACLRSFSASEMLCQRNKFFCDACCGLQEAEKRMKIKKLPNVLALHLKRFKYQEDTQKYVKLAYRVAFPHELRLFDTVDDAEDPDRLYELFAIVVHIGTGPHHGHYIAIIKSRGTWLVFDDNSVETMKESEIPKYFGDGNGGSGYVLFYQAV